MDATDIARRTHGLTGFDLARAWDALATETAAVIATGTLDASDLLAACDRHRWFRDMQAHAARNA